MAVVLEIATPAIAGTLLPMTGWELEMVPVAKETFAKKIVVMGAVQKEGFDCSDCCCILKLCEGDCDGDCDCDCDCDLGGCDL